VSWRLLVEGCIPNSQKNASVFFFKKYKIESPPSLAMVELAGEGLWPWLLALLCHINGTSLAKKMKK
jgi:hypothetical protein